VRCDGVWFGPRSSARHAHASPPLHPGRARHCRGARGRANLGFAPRSAARRAAAAGGNLEIFSWWTSAGEVEALDALYAIFKGQYPDVNIINAALAGGPGPAAI